MKKILLLAGVAFLFTANAQARVSQYVSGKVSYDFNQVKFKAGNDAFRSSKRLHRELFGTHFAYGVRAGYVRGELELNNSNTLKFHKDFNGIDSRLKLNKTSVMANAYFDYLTCTPWTPYVGAGIGTAYLTQKLTNEPLGHSKKSVYNLAWQVMAGVTYDINSNWAIDAGYKYADLGRVRKNFGPVKTKVAVRDHEILLGARYSF